MDMLEANVVGASQENKTLIDKYEEDYRAALESIDNDVKELIQSGKEMMGIILFSENVSAILDVHESLHNFYSIIYNHQEVLNRFGSERLQQLGHELKATVKLLKDTDATPDQIERYVLLDLQKIGFRKTHWYINSRFLTEIEYMLETLRVLVEPEFIPLENAVIEPTEEDKPDRYVSSAVKLTVWRRDHGKCVECSSKEKLEYDHIIPVSKGGSNTERNIQLLCEKCNRQKSASIQ